jgi:hypothetical protein
MLAKMQNHGFDETGEPILDIGFVDEPFIKGEVSKFENGYDAVLSFDLGDINTGDGEVYFNAYRLETDGGNKNAHLFALNPTLHDWFHVPNRFVYLKDFVK